MKKLTIAVDLDGTIINTMPVFAKLYHERYQDREVPAMTHITGWDLDNTFDIHIDEMWDIFRQARDEKHYKYAAPTDSNFHYWIKELQNQGHELYILTHNPKEFEETIKYWLSKYEVELPVHCVQEKEHKNQFEYDILIDDAPSQATNRAWQEENRHFIVYHNPWNLMVEQNSHIHRAHNWHHVKELINQIAYA